MAAEAEDVGELEITGVLQFGEGGQGQQAEKPKRCGKEHTGHWKLQIVSPKLVPQTASQKLASQNNCWPV